MKYVIIKNKVYGVEPSLRLNKKYDVILFNPDKTKKFITSFGDKRYQQYYDYFGHYKNLNHNDKERRKRYRLRHKNDIGVVNDDPNYAGYWSWYYLW